MEKINIMKEIYEKVMSKLIAIGSDKYMHFTIGAILSVIVMALALIFTSPYIASTVGFLVSIISGAVKEMIDIATGGNGEGDDLMATAAGGFVPMIAVWLILI